MAATLEGLKRTEDHRDLSWQWIIRSARRESHSPNRESGESELPDVSAAYVTSLKQPLLVLFQAKVISVWSGLADAIGVLERALFHSKRVREVELLELPRRAL